MYYEPTRKRIDPDFPKVEDLPHPERLRVAKPRDRSGSYDKLLDSIDTWFNPSIAGRLLSLIGKVNVSGAIWTHTRLKLLDWIVVTCLEPPLIYGIL